MPLVFAGIVPHPPIVIPEVGHGAEKGIDLTARSYRKWASAVCDSRPELILIVSPHAQAWRDHFQVAITPAFRGSLRAFRAPYPVITAHGATDAAPSLIDALSDTNYSCGLTDGTVTELDHGSFIPLYYIARQIEGDAGPQPAEQAEYQLSPRLILLSISGLDRSCHVDYGRRLGRWLDGRPERVAVVISGDLSHRLKTDGPYGYTPEGPEFDRHITDIVTRAAWSEFPELDPSLCEMAGECGLRPLLILSGIMEGRRSTSTLHSYEGVFGVGYLVAEIHLVTPSADDDADQAEADEEASSKTNRSSADTLIIDPRVGLALRTIRCYVNDGERLRLNAAERQSLPADMTDRAAGVFVSIHKNDQLRGCIGTIGPTCPCIADEIIQNAISASTRDPRFPAVGPSELDQLDVSVDVLGEMESIDGPDELDVKRYGVVVSSGHRRGLLLPDLEGVDTTEKQIAIALAKAGISPSEPYRLQRFEVVRYH